MKTLIETYIMNSEPTPTQQAWDSLNLAFWQAWKAHDTAYAADLDTIPSLAAIDAIRSAMQALIPIR